MTVARRGARRDWGFCSGSDFSEWLIFNAPAGPDGEGHMFVVPREDTATIDDWFPTGMRGTGSRTMAVDDVFVPDHRVQATRDTVQKLAERRALHPTFDTTYAHWHSYGRFTFASTAVGAAWVPSSEMVSHHVTLNWRQSAVRYLNTAVQG